MKAYPRLFLSRQHDSFEPVQSASLPRTKGGKVDIPSPSKIAEKIQIHKKMGQVIYQVDRTSGSTNGRQATQFVFSMRYFLR